MAQDYAKRHSTVAQAEERLPRWSYFIVGFILGLFCAFLFYLWQAVPVDTPPDTPRPTPEISIDKEADEIQWDFYEIFPKSEVPIVEEYTPGGEKKVVTKTYSYALQAGSFTRQADADRLRAELLLLGMEVFIQEAERNNDTWYRVLVGPMETQLELDRTRNRLAEANIESIQLRMNR